jgi:hypothetical protein
MKALGIELSGSELIYVLVKVSEGETTVLSVNKLALSHTRKRNALIAFQTALRAVFTELSPSVIGIKEKPEKGRLSAGAPALKMEGIAIASSPCPVHFISGARVNGCDVQPNNLRKYQIPAFKAAVVAAGIMSD